MSGLKQCTPMSGIVAQRIAAPTSRLEADDFTALARYEDPVEDLEPSCDEDDQQLVEVLEDDGSEDGEEREEYLDDVDDEYCAVDDGVSASSASEEEGTDAVDAVDNNFACEFAVDEEICESENIDDAEVILLQRSNHSDETFGSTSVDSSMYCSINLT